MEIVRKAVGFCRDHFWQLVRFVIVGGITFLIYLGSFHVFFDEMHLDYRIAVSIAYVITVSCHFLLNRTFTFKAHSQRIRKTAPRYGAMLIFNYAITLLISWLTVDVFHASPYLAPLTTTVGTSMSSFLVMKFFVFRGRPDAMAEENPSATARGA